MIGIREIFYFLSSITIIGGLLIYLKFLLVPLFFSCFLTYLLKPIVNLVMMRPFKILENKKINQNVILSMFHTLSFFKIPKMGAILLVVFMVMFSIVGFCILIIYSIEQIEDHFDNYNRQFHFILEKFLQWMKDMKWINDRSQLEWKDIINHLPFGNIGTIILFFLKSTLEIIENITLVLFITTFLLIEWINPKNPVDKTFYEIKTRVDAEMWTYIIFKTIISAFVGFSIGFVLFLFAIDLAFIFGLLSFILNYIPNIGCIIATSLPIPIILLDFEKSWTVKVLSITIPIFIHFFVGNIIEPVLFGDKNRLHPMAILMSLLFWSTVWGFVGAILSVPLLITTRIILENIQHPLSEFVLYYLINYDNNNGII